MGQIERKIILDLSEPGIMGSQLYRTTVLQRGFKISVFLLECAYIYWLSSILGVHPLLRKLRKTTLLPIKYFFYYASYAPPYPFLNKQL